MSTRRRIEDYRSLYLTPGHQAYLAGQFPSCEALGPDGTMALLDGGEDNVNVLLCDAGGAPRFVARHYLISSPSRIAIELRLVTTLAGFGYPTPAPVATASGELFLERLPEPAIALFPFVEGDVSADWSHVRRRVAATAVARLHQLCLQSGYRTGIGKPRREALQWGAAWIAKAQIAGHEDLTAEISRFLTSRLEPQLKRLWSLPSGPVHHDLNYGNVVWHNDEVAAIIDFDECHDAPLIMDLVAGFSCLALDVDYQLDLEACLAIIEGYERVRRLELDELQMLPLAWELFSLVGGVEYLLANADRVRSIYESRSFKLLYLEQRSRMREFAADLSRSR